MTTSQFAANNPPADEDFYALLRIAPDAGADEIRRAYAPLAQEATNANDRARFERLHNAFETLKEPERRAQYDRQRQQAANATMLGMPATAPPVPNSTATGGGAAAQMNELLPLGNDADGRTAFLGATQLGGAGGVPLGKHACPYDESPCAVDGGYCVKCGFLIGSPLGEKFVALPLPSLKEVSSGRVLALKLGENVVGREGTDVMLNDKSVSRRHAVIQVETGNVVALSDQNSTNGTKHNSTRLTANIGIVPLKDGDTVQFGTVALTITIPQAATRPRLALPSASAQDRPAQTAIGGKVAGYIGGSAPSSTGAPVAPGTLAVAPQQRARLLGAKDSTTHTLAKSATTFGRKPINDVVLSGDSFVSGTHARIERENNTFYVVDLGSTNGTKHNGTKLAPNVRHSLADGDAVAFGQTEFTFRLG